MMTRNFVCLCVFEQEVKLVFGSDRSSRSIYKKHSKFIKKHLKYFKEHSRNVQRLRLEHRLHFVKPSEPKILRLVTLVSLDYYFPRHLTGPRLSWTPQSPHDLSHNKLQSSQMCPVVKHFSLSVSNITS